MRFWKASDGVTGILPPTLPKRLSSEACTDSAIGCVQVERKQKEKFEEESLPVSVGLSERSTAHYDGIWRHIHQAVDDVEQNGS